MDDEGKLDLGAGLLAQMEFVIASFHRGTFPPKDKETHTKALVCAMENNADMHILGHPGCKFFPMDIEAVVQAAARTCTIIEINNQSLNPECYRFHGQETFLEILKFCKQYGVPVLASSDAHYHTSVGNLERAKEVILKAGIGEEQVVNTCAKRFLGAIQRKKELFAK
jgi:putative hydrolase